MERKLFQIENKKFLFLYIEVKDETSDNKIFFVLFVYTYITFLLLLHVHTYVNKIFVETVNVHKEDTMCFETIPFVYDVRKTYIRFKVFHRILNTGIMDYRFSTFPLYHSVLYLAAPSKNKREKETKCLNVGKYLRRTNEQLFAKCTNTVLERSMSQYLYYFSYFMSLSLPTYIFQFI